MQKAVITKQREDNKQNWQLRIRFLLQIIFYILVFIAAPIVTGIVAGWFAIEERYGTPPPFYARAVPPQHDPNKPTVAVLLGHRGTVISDFTVPYELFSASGKFNVYAVASERKLSPLDGGLDVLPHFSLVELQTLLDKSPDVIVVPGMFELQSAEHQPLFKYLKNNANNQTLIFSICTGAEVLAQAGLLNNRAATTHWAEIDDLEKQYPAVRWQREVRYVDDGNIITAAGVTTGIDGTLHILDKLAGRDVAYSAAETINYRNLHFLTSPKFEQKHFEINDSVFLLNRMFNWSRPTLGVLLYNEMGEIDVSALMESYAATYSATMETVAPERAVIRTRHNLHLVPRWTFENAPHLDKIVATGSKAHLFVSAEAQQSIENKQQLELQFVHQKSKEAAEVKEFPFDAPLIDLAQVTNLSVAQFAAKRLEVVAPDFASIKEAKGYPFHLFIIPFVISILGVGLFALVMRQIRNK